MQQRPTPELGYDADLAWAFVGTEARIDKLAEVGHG
jgi:hypothetical protein